MVDRKEKSTKKESKDDIDAECLKLTQIARKDIDIKNRASS